MTNFEYITRSERELAWAILDALRCDISFCNACGTESSCPLFGTDWSKIHLTIESFFLNDYAKVKEEKENLEKELFELKERQFKVEQATDFFMQ